MSRYKNKIHLTNEIELPEISGIKFLIYPTIEAKLDLVDLVKQSQMFEEIDKKDSSGKVIETKRIRGKYFNIRDVANVCAKLVYEGCWEHDGEGNRTQKKEEEKETTERDILMVVLNSDVMNLYLECLRVLDIIESDKLDEIKQAQVNAEKN